MSILTKSLPSVLVISGKEYPINTDFRVWLKFSEIINDRSRTKTSKANSLVMLVFGEIPENAVDCLRGAELFFAGEPEEKAGPGGRKKRTFDFSQDAELIYAAFYQQYGIDLCSADLHWWQFRALFEGLGSTTQFIKVLEYRSMEIDKIEDKKMRAFYAKMKKQYALPDNRTQEEREREAAEFFDC